MKEQSHKDEMSAAIRGDFRRLRDRGVAATLAPREEEDVPGLVEIVPEHEEPVASVVAASSDEDDVPDPEEVVPEPEPEEPAAAVVAAALPEPVAAALPEPAAEPRADEEDDPGDAERTGFLARLFGR